MPSTVLFANWGFADARNFCNFRLCEASSGPEVSEYGEDDNFA